MDNLAFTLPPIIIGSVEEAQFLSTDHQLMRVHKKGGQPDAPLACAGQTETITGHGDVLSVDNSHCSVDEFNPPREVGIGLFVSIFLPTQVEYTNINV